MTTFTEHISKHFYDEAVKKAKEIEQMYASDTSVCQARLDFTTQMLDYKRAYLQGLVDTLLYAPIPMENLGVNYLEISTKLDEVIGFLANEIKKENQ